MPRRRRPTFGASDPPTHAPADYGSVSISVPRSAFNSSLSVSADSPPRIPRANSISVAEGPSPGDRRQSGDRSGDRPGDRSMSRRSNPNFVNRWLRRNSSAAGESRQRLLDPNSRRSSMDADVVGIPMEHDDDDSAFPVFDYPDSEVSLNSEIASRSSFDSTIDDVCMPLESPREDVSIRQSRTPKVWPDINVLNEFSLQELKEMAEIEAAEATDGNTDTEHGRLASHAPSDRYAVNEAEEGGPLRPRRHAPWGKARSRAKSTFADPVDDQARVNFNSPVYRFAYFRDSLPATIHSPTISQLLQPGQVFEDLFPPVLLDNVSTKQPASLNQSLRPSTPTSSTATPVDRFDGSSGSQTQNHNQSHAPTLIAPLTSLNPASDGGMAAPAPAEAAAQMQQLNASTTPTGSPRVFPEVLTSTAASQQRELGPGAPIGPSASGAAATERTSSLSESIRESGKQDAPSISEAEQGSDKESGPFWLDVLNPTEEELRVLAKAFGIHPLTTEDIFLRETREKVELFHSYYFICFASFDISQKTPRKLRRRKASGARSSTSVSSSRANRVIQEKLKPVPVYTIVFKTGVISIHYTSTVHTINVRRRIRLLRDYLNLSSDWISYALIDDITDGFAPLIAGIEQDVTAIEDAILHMHGGYTDSESDDDHSVAKSSSTSSTSSTEYREWAKRDMLRWIGESRKRVMGLLGLLGNKADVIKGFSKRVTEQWSGASRTEIALYLSDIQDHLVTMVQSLNHYEKLLARSHSNYLAQLNIDMTISSNATNDVLGKLSVLGTIVLPLNIITGLWGMNVVVPGQYREDSLIWFWSIMIGMVTFAVVTYFVIQRFL